MRALDVRTIYIYIREILPFNSLVWGSLMLAPTKEMLVMFEGNFPLDRVFKNLMRFLVPRKGWTMHELILLLFIMRHLIN